MTDALEIAEGAVPGEPVEFTMGKVHSSLPADHAHHEGVP
jgi:hypothetical protein